MRQFLILRAAFLGSAIALTSGCARQTNLHTPDPNVLSQAGDEQSLPFDQEGRKTGGSLVPASEELPAGTLIAVRLKSAISSKDSHSGERFEAVIDEPVVVDGRSLLKPGIRVEGTVVSARASTGPYHPGYLRLTLSRVLVGGTPVAFSTNSVFAKGGTREREKLANVGAHSEPSALESGTTRLDKGALLGASAGSSAPASPTEPVDVTFSVEKRLTFRVTQPFSLKN